MWLCVCVCVRVVDVRQTANELESARDLLGFGRHVGEERLDLSEITANLAVEFSHLGAQIWRSEQQGSGDSVP